MPQELNPNYRTSTTAYKAAGDAGVAGAAGGVAALVSPLIVDMLVAQHLLPEAMALQAVSITTALVGALAMGAKRFLRNRKKNKFRNRANRAPLGTPLAPIVLALIAFTMVLQGCITTENADGSTTTRFDTESALTLAQFTYLMYVQERERLAAENALEDAQKERERQQRLAIVTQLAERMRDELERTGVRIPALEELQN